MPTNGAPPSLPLDGETPLRTLTGVGGALVSAWSIGLSLYSLYWVLFVVQPQVYRISFLLVALVLCFLVFPARRTDSRPRALDWILILVAIAALAWPLVDF